jgi:uncharacterized membrane protein YhaH (DUF805 family)
MYSNSFATAVLPLKRYADFRGRSTRTELLFFYLLFWTVTTVVHFSGAALGKSWSEWILLAWWLATALPTAALFVRRLHDVGWSGWWLAGLLPIAAFNFWQQVERARDPF